MIVWVGLGAVALAFFISAMATPLAARVAMRFGMIDLPQRHKAHAEPTPQLGGSAIFAAILGPSLLALAIAQIWASGGAPAWVPKAIAVHLPGVALKAPQALGILLMAMLLHVVGVIDDRKNLGPWLKLAVQAVVAAFTVTTASRFHGRGL